MFKILYYILFFALAVACRKSEDLQSDFYHCNIGFTDSSEVHPNNIHYQTLINEIINHAEKGSVFYTDKFKSYKSLKFYGKHISIDHGKEFGKGRRHINGLEGFWSFAKEPLLKYHGVSKSYFHLYLKEMEFRYNYRKENIYHKLIKIHFGPFSA